MTITHLLAIDVETSGMGLRSNFLIQIGAALIDYNTGTRVDGFSSYLQQPENTIWEPRCVEEFWSKHPVVWKTAQEGIATASPSFIVRQNFIDWVTNACKDRNVQIIFDTAGFDQAWMDYFLGDVSCLYITGKYRQPIDFSSYLCGLTECGFDQNPKKVYCERHVMIDWPKWEEKHDHNAINDATCIGRDAWYIFKQHLSSKHYLNY
jgi:hypothetical protein